MDSFDILDGDFGGPISWVLPAEDTPPLAQPERPAANAARMLRARIAGRPALSVMRCVMDFISVVGEVFRRGRNRPEHHHATDSPRAMLRICSERLRVFPGNASASDAMDRRAWRKWTKTTLAARRPAPRRKRRATPSSFLPRADSPGRTSARDPRSRPPAPREIQSALFPRLL